VIVVVVLHRARLVTVWCGVRADVIVVVAARRCVQCVL